MALSDAAAFAVAAWSLDEASGARADQVGSSNLSDNNTVASGAGKLGTAADFESANSEYLSVASSATLQTPGKLCVRAWVKLESTPGVLMSIVSKDVSGGREFNLYLDTSNRFGFIRLGAASVTLATSFGAVSSGVWYLLHGWYDPATGEQGISVNGTANTVTVATGITAVGSAQLRVGARQFSGFENYFDGLIDDVVLLKGYILDATERSEDYNAGGGVAFADWAAPSAAAARRLIGRPLRSVSLIGGGLLG